MVKVFFYNGHMLKKINRSFITLISKLDNLESSNHYRFISLCIVWYKILANRVEPLPNKIVFHLQGHFLHVNLLMIIFF